MKHPIFRHFSLLLILLISASTIGYFSAQHNWLHDITQNNSNSLQPESIKVLQQLNAPVIITAYATEYDTEIGDIRKAIREFITLYQRVKPDLTLKFIDPEKEPELARKENIQLNGEMIISYQGRSERLSQLNEPVLTNTLLRLANTSEHAIMYMDGHGERKLDGIANHDLGSYFGAKLKQNGFKIQPLNLAVAPDVPSNNSLLVITQPRVEILAGEREKLLQFIRSGGNLLWLLDTGDLNGLEPLAEELGIMLPRGIIIDPAAEQMNAPITWSLGTGYSVNHPATQNFNLITAFPLARPLIWQETPEWQHHILLEVPERGWVYRSEQFEEPIPPFNKQRDIPGPATLALSLEREINNKAQRIIIVGNAAFLSNSFVGNGGNLDLGLNMINWLSHEDHLISIQPQPVKDHQITLSRKQLIGMGASLLLVLPMLFILAGLRIWWLRRRSN